MESGLVLDRLTRAFTRWPAGTAEDELLRSTASLACTDLGSPWAVVWRRRAPGGWSAAAWWPQAATLPDSPQALGATLPLGTDLLLQLGGDGGALFEAYAAGVGRLLEEARVRGALARRAEELARRELAATERHRDLLIRTEQLHRELDATGRRQLLLGERNRIAQDLHDRAAQTFFLINLKAQWLLEHLLPGSPLHGEVERLGELATQGAAQMREAIYALRAPELTEGGLPEGLGRLVRGLEADGMATSLTVTGRPVPVAPEVEDALFKVAQEALNNCRKHSGASAVMVALCYGPESVSLVVQDDGTGLPAGAEENPQRLGLRGMRERVRAEGGELALVADDDGGLIVRATIPLGKR